MDPHPYGSLDGFDTQDVFILSYLLAERFLSHITWLVGRLRISNNTTKPAFSDAEMLATVLTKELKAPQSSFRAWFFELAHDFKPFFPDLPCRTRWMRRKNKLAVVIETFRRWLLDTLNMGADPIRLLDSMPIALLPPWRVKGGKNKRWGRDAGGGPDGHMGYPTEIGQADLGYCAAKKQHYFGMKLQVSSTTSALPTHWMLTPASWHDIKCLEDMVAGDPWRHDLVQLVVDKGYLSADLAQWIREQYDVIVNAPPKVNSKQQWPKHVRKVHSKIRGQIERIFGLGAQHVGLQSPRSTTFKGLLAEVSAKMTAMTMFALKTNLAHLI